MVSWVTALKLPLLRRLDDDVGALPCSRQNDNLTGENPAPSLTHDKSIIIHTHWLNGLCEQKKKKLNHSDVAIHLTLPYTLGGPLLYLIYYLIKLFTIM